MQSWQTKKLMYSYILIFIKHEEFSLGLKIYPIYNFELAENV